MRVLEQPGAASDYHEDHIVPLCAGGHPDDPRNLWPQPLHSQWSDNDKNQLERSVCRMLCRGGITLKARRVAEAQASIEAAQLSANLLPSLLD